MKNLFLVLFLAFSLLCSCMERDINEITVDAEPEVSDLELPPVNDGDLSDTDATISDEDSKTGSDSDLTPENDDDKISDKDVVPSDEDKNDNDDDKDDNVVDPYKIRIMAANTTSGNAQAYEGPGIRIFQAFQPDIVLVQEMNYKSGSWDYFVDEYFGEEFDYYRGTGQIPNGVISRWPILKHGYWDDPNIGNRDLDWAIVDIPGPTDIFAVSVHLHTKPSSDQVAAAKIIARKVYEHRNDNPGKYYYVVGGDFNGPSAVSDEGFGKHNGSDVFHVDRPHPVDNYGEWGTNASRSKQYDFVLPDHNLHNKMVPVVIGSNSFENGLVFDSRVYTPLSDVAPVKKSDSGATNMQHMAIIKDFMIDGK